MSRFYVGQRVRVVRTLYGRLVGREATIVALNVIGRIAETGAAFPGHEISVDGEGIYVAPPEWLEPLTDPGRQVVSWEGSIWMPEHLREKAPESEGVKV